MPVQVIASSYTDGPALSAAAAASCLPTYVPTTLPAGYWQIGRMWRITASGRISTVVTTPGTARFDLRMAAVTAWDSLAIPLNIVARVNVSWYLEVLLTCRSVGSGTSATLFGHGMWLSDDNINVALPATGPGPGGQRHRSGAGVPHQIALADRRQVDGKRPSAAGEFDHRRARLVVGRIGGAERDVAGQGLGQPTGYRIVHMLQDGVEPLFSSRIGRM